MLAAVPVALRLARSLLHLPLSVGNTGLPPAVAGRSWGKAAARRRHPLSGTQLILQVAELGLETRSLWVWGFLDRLQGSCAYVDPDARRCKTC